LQRLESVTVLARLIPSGRKMGGRLAELQREIYILNSKNAILQTACPLPEGTQILLKGTVGILGSLAGGVAGAKLGGAIAEGLDASQEIVNAAKLFGGFVGAGLGGVAGAEGADYLTTKFYQNFETFKELVDRFEVKVREACDWVLQTLDELKLDVQYCIKLVENATLNLQRQRPATRVDYSVANESIEKAIQHLTQRMRG